MSTAVLSFVVIVLLAGVVYGYTQISTLNKQLGTLSNELASTTAKLSQNTDELSKNITDLSAKASSTQENINEVKNQVGGVEQTLGSVSGSLSDLQKLAQTDPELLKKYSKVYFMNENYTPAHLVAVPNEYLYSEKRAEQFLAEALPFLQNLFANAKASGISLYVKSAYRSFAEQKTLKTIYTVTYGAGTANSFSADQGYSEHQIGTTVDFITSGLNGQLVVGFDKTPAFQWLTNNAHRYGFVLSYPKGNTYYVYEPWHWRFVGVKLATYLHDTNTKFYDMDQREIDKYLINTFDM